MSRTAVGVEAGRDVVVHGPMTVTVSSSMMPAPPVKSFRNVSAPIKAFQGREHLIKRIHEELVRKSALSHWSDRTLALVGFGGMGKTELARKFAEVHDQTYPNVAWINAETEKSITDSFENLAQTLELPCNSNDTGREIAGRVYCHVGQHVPSTLFVFDNATQLHSENGSFGILEYLPCQTHKNQPFCLVTTQSMDWAAQNIDTLEVQELTKEESIQFLMQRFKLSPADLQKESPEGDTLGSLMEQLYEYVQGYPLALQLAAASVNYMPKKDTTSFLQNRLEIFLRKVKALDAKSVLDKSVSAGGSDYDRTIRIIWGVLMERIKKDEYSAEGLHLLKILAYTDPDGAPCKDLEQVYNVSLAAESKTDEEKTFESVLHLLQKLVIVQTYKGLRAELYTRMHRMVQCLTRRDDSDGNGLRYIIQGKKSEVLRHFFTSQPQFSIPPSILRSDELVIAWLRCFVEIATSWGSNSYGKVLLFDSTHEEQLRERHSASIIDDILATVDLVRKLMSAQWIEDAEAKICGLIDFARNLKRDSELFGSLLEITLVLMRRTMIRSSEQEIIAIKLKEWLCHPATIFPLPSGHELNLLVNAVLIKLESAVDQAELRNKFTDHPEYSVHITELVKLIRPHFLDGIWSNFEEAVEALKGTDLELFWKWPHVKILLSDHKLAIRLMTEPNLNVQLKNSLESTQAKFHAKYKQLLEERDAIGIQNLSCASNRTEPRPGLQSDIDKEDEGDVLELYMGYVLCYQLALNDYDLAGESFSGKLKKWLPSFEYLSKAPLCLELAAGGCKLSYDHLCCLCIWKTDDDAVTLDRVCRENCVKDEMDVVSTTAHTALVQALQKFRQDLPDANVLNEMMKNIGGNSDSEEESEDDSSASRVTEGDLPRKSSYDYVVAMANFRDPLTDIAEKFISVRRSLRHPEVVGRLLMVADMSTELKTILQSTQALPSEKQGACRNPSPSCPTYSEGHEEGFESTTAENDQDLGEDVALMLYMGYVLCYSLALYDHDLAGGSYSEKLEKWLPSSDYIITAPLRFELADNDTWDGRYFLTFLRWKREADGTILNRVLRVMSEQNDLDAVSNAAHRALVQSLQKFSEKLPDTDTLEEILKETRNAWGPSSSEEESADDSSDVRTEMPDRNEKSVYFKPFPGVLHGMSHIEAIQALRDTETDTDRKCIIAKALLHNRELVARIIVEANLHVGLKEALQSVQARLYAKWDIKSTKGVFGRFALNLRSRIDKFLVRLNSRSRNAGSSRRRNPGVTSPSRGQEVAFKSNTAEEIKADDGMDVVGLYMGYVICYSLAVSDYDLTGGTFSEKLEKWLPTSEYLSKGPFCLEMVSNEIRNLVDFLTKLQMWQMIDDAPILDRVLHEICAMDELEQVSPSGHIPLVQALQKFCNSLPDEATLQEMLRSVFHSG